MDLVPAPPQQLAIRRRLDSTPHVVLECVIILHRDLLEPLDEARAEGRERSSPGACAAIVPVGLSLARRLVLLVPPRDLVHPPPVVICC